MRARRSPPCCPSYLNALAGKGVHVVTVNDYLAKRDSEWMGRIHRFLGLEVGVILAQMTPEERRKQYAADITYGTNNEFGFDYLRDNMAWGLEECVQRGHHYAIVDEVDSILIDEARTPLIISGPAEQSARWYTEFAKIAPRLRNGARTASGDYEVDEKKRTVGILESGVEKVEDWLGIDNLYESVNTPLVSFLNNAIKAKELYKQDKDYVVMNGEVLIVDEFTGRILHGRRYNEGMHQAIEAKEGVQIQNENQTLATITLQNYFRLYEKLAGMTGTAMTEANEFHQIYKLGVVPIPTNMPMIRADQPDVVYQTAAGQVRGAASSDIVERHEAGPAGAGRHDQRGEVRDRCPGCSSAAGVPHEVLNAKYHEREAAIIAQAGRKGAVTVATNMAGRGTDIMLGGNPEFIADAELHQRGLSPVDTPGGLRGGVAGGGGEGQAGGGRGARGGRRGRRAVRARHRTARVAPDRQPAARPVRPAGRPRGVPVLPVARRRPDADVQRRQGRALHGVAQDAAGRADRVEGGHPVDPVRADPGRAAELRDPQGRAQVRRRAEPPAPGHLRGAPRRCWRARTCTSRSAR